MLPISPTKEEKKEALKHPNGWIYRIDGNYDVDGDIPPRKIIGAWKVDGQGKIIGDFIQNQHYRKD